MDLVSVGQSSTSRFLIEITSFQEVLISNRYNDLIIFNITFDITIRDIQIFYFEIFLESNFERKDNRFSLIDTSERRKSRSFERAVDRAANKGRKSMLRYSRIRSVALQKRTSKKASIYLDA